MIRVRPQKEEKRFVRRVSGERITTHRLYRWMHGLHALQLSAVDRPAMIKTWENLPGS
jgi:hypothetical protein